MSNFKTSNTTIMNWKSKQKHVFLCLKSSSGSHIAYRIKSKFLSMLFNAFFFFLFVSNSVRPRIRQPTRLPRPWDSPGKNTGVGCHFLLQCMKVKT